jgi:hypothetical protein
MPLRELFFISQKRGGQNMRKLLMGGLAVGAAYFLKDKKNRQKLMNQIQSFNNQSAKK